ncbi:hypothetical protein AAP_01042 [Ascosphaera apis ARSEF 7405]|uniref:Uncharacterized protein n=1 Tax=Ascosphaera apis ARSEF 7405 TaxID=392613 RepID=A0A168C872_9EURO|nr:hypothetical protein AAP_01042 [Ascosphaera apis ARSEF 7405]
MSKRKLEEDQFAAQAEAQAEAALNDTNKRWRPGRSEQEEIYAKTIRSLFDAQKRLHQQERARGDTSLANDIDIDIDIDNNNNLDLSLEAQQLQSLSLNSSLPNHKQSTLYDFFTRS